jgi:hypothetical protein
MSLIAALQLHWTGKKNCFFYAHNIPLEYVLTYLFPAATAAHLSEGVTETLTAR